MRFNRLPTEIQFDVFATISADELCEIVAPVCRRWRQFAYESTLWTQIALVGDQSSNQMIKILENSPHIRRLEFGDVHDFEWIKNIPIRKSLREMLFYSCTLTEKTILQFVTVFPHVQLCYEYWFMSQINDITQYIGKWDYLTDITLPYFGVRDLDSIADDCKNLERFHAVSLDDISVCSFINFITKRGPQLRMLDLREMDHFTSDTFDFLSRCCKLTTLRLIGSRSFTDNNFFNIEKMKDLRHLEILGSDELFSSTFCELFSSVDFPRVTTVIFKDCSKLSYSALDCFVQKCKESLRVLDVSLSAKFNFAECWVIASTYNFKLTRPERPDDTCNLEKSVTTLNPNSIKC